MRRKQKQSGFTLMEILIALGIFAMLALSVSWILIHSLRSNAVIWDQLQTQNDGRRALQEMVDDIRRAESSSLGDFSLYNVEEDDLIFYANIDSDTLRERVHYWLEGTTLNKGVVKPSGNPLAYDTGSETVTEIAHDVVNTSEDVSLFLYYDQDFTGTEDELEQPVDTAEVNVIKIQLELESDPDKTPVPLHVESTVQVRNLKTN